MNPDRIPGPSGSRLAAVLAAGTLAPASCTASVVPPAGAQALAPPPATADEPVAEDQGVAVPPRFGDRGHARDDEPDRVGIGPLPLLTLRF